MNKTPTFIRHFLVAIYLATWLLFGFAYQWLANETGGKAFIFNEDVRVTAQINAFKQAVGSTVNDVVIHSILKTEHGKRFGIRIQTPDVKEYLYSDQPMGLNWATFYADRLAKDGATHFETQVIDRSKPPLAGVSTWIGGVPQVNGGEFWKVRLTLVRGEPGVVPTPDHPMKSRHIIATHIIWTDRQPDQLSIEGKPILAMTTDFLPGFLQHSYTYFDDSLYALQKIESGRFTYSIWDFLYFSTVTITTVGYGDILPATTTTRIMVMIEAMLGIILAGAFVSSLFWVPRQDEQNKEMQ